MGILTLITLLVGVPGAAAGGGAWKLSHNLTGDKFFDGFDFFTQP